LQQQEDVGGGEELDMQSYLQNETGRQQQRTKTAEQMLALGNRALQNGNPQQARRAFESAYGLSAHDEAFNEDARVQLNNLKLQQALVGLNVRQAAVTGASGAAGGKLNELRNTKDANYTQQDAQRIIASRSADDNAAFVKLAERLIQQQDAAGANAAAIRANIPERGRLLTFKRAVVVDTWADLGLQLQASAANAVSWTARLLMLVVTGLGLGGLGLLARHLLMTPQRPG
jgi:hypothetical protein